MLASCQLILRFSIYMRSKDYKIFNKTVGNKTVRFPIVYLLLTPGAVDKIAVITISSYYNQILII